MITSKFDIDKLLGKGKAEKSSYQPTQPERDRISYIINCFSKGYTTSQASRQEFNDLSVVQRSQVDKLSFNAYQANNGRGLSGDVANAWRSNAMKPVVRNKAVSIVAHALGRNLYPAISAYDNQNQSQTSSAQVMRDLMEWAGDKSGWQNTSMQAVMTAMFSPACIVYSEFADVYRDIVRDGKPETILDSVFSGFSDVIVPVEELYIENIYESNIQKQGWLIWRRTPSYSSAFAKYKEYPNFKHVDKGMQTIFNDANQQFYNVYDPQLRGELVEEVIFWHRQLDLMLIVVNGVLLTDANNPNPRLDKNYPFTKFGYLPINEGKFFYYRSLAFALQQDANVINTLYPLYVDGSIMEYNAPLQNNGGEIVTAADVVPGSVINFTSEGSKLSAVIPPRRDSGILNSVNMVEASIADTATPPVIDQGVTATQSLIQKQQAATVLDLFMRMIATFIVDYGNLKISDILQNLTVANGLDNDGKTLMYQSFVLGDKNGQDKARTIKFDGAMPTELSELQQLYESYKIFIEQKDNELIKVNPALFRKYYYECKVYADTLAPTTSELERAYVQEIYGMLSTNPIVNQEELVRLILQNSPATKKNVDKFIAQAAPQGQMPSGAGMMPQPIPDQNGITTSQNEPMV